MNEVGLEAVESVFYGRSVADEKGVEGEVFFHADGQKRAGKLHKLHSARGVFVVVRCLRVGFGRLGVNAEKREIATLCVGDEVARGVGDAVDLMEGVREVGDAGRTHRDHFTRSEGGGW